MSFLLWQGKSVVRNKTLFITIDINKINRIIILFFKEKQFFPEKGKIRIIFKMNNSSNKKIIVKLFLLALIVFAADCKNDKLETGNKTSTETSVSERRKDSLKIIKSDTGAIFEGLYIINKNTNSFRDCRYPDSIYLVNDETGNLKKSYEKIFSVKNVYGSVYARFKGEKKATDGINSEKYPSTLYVKEVLQLEKKNFRNTCINYEFWALGNEPGWSLQISKNENIIEFYDFSDKKSYYCFYEEPVDEDGAIVYAAHNNIQRYTIKIRIRKEKCSDTMSDTSYDYSAEVELSKGKKFKGCAIKGKEQ